MVGVYIGYLDDPKFKWDGGDWSGNIPKRRSPFFPTAEPFSDLIDDIRQGKFEGKQTDWGAFVAKATKAQILEFIDECYPPGWDENFPWLTKRMKKLKKFIDRLEPDRLYALVAVELY